MLEEIGRNMDEIKDPLNMEIDQVDMMEVFSNLYGMKPSEYINPKEALVKEELDHWNKEINPVVNNDTDAEFKKLSCKY